MKRLGLLLVIVVLFAAVWRQLDRISLVVIGQPSSSGTIQREKESPFFQTLQASTRLPIQVTYRPLEALGFKDTHQLQMLEDGLFDLVSLRFLQNRKAEPCLEGIDLAGMIQDYRTAHAVTVAYAPTLDRCLQERFGVKLLGVWTFGPQEFFSREPIRGLDDIKGRKVRVGDASLAPIITAIGGIPAVIPFDDTRQALEIGLVDCAVTSAASATYAGWTQHAPHYFPLAVHFGLNGYVISLKKWNALSQRQQEVLQEAFDAYLADLWRFSEELHSTALRGGAGLMCSRGDCPELTVAEVAPEDLVRLRELSLAVALPSWAARCETVHPGGVEEWRATLATLLDLPPLSAAGAHPSGDHQAR